MTVEDPGLTGETAPRTSLNVAIVAATLDENAIGAHIAAMPPEEAFAFLTRLADVLKRANFARSLVQQRLVTLGQDNGTFTDPIDGKTYRYARGRSRRIKDIPGFVEQLAADGIDARPLIPWLSSSAFRVGETIEGDERVQTAVKEWAVWEDDKSLSLIEIDPVTGKALKR